jgi:hypothetical protein
MCEVRHSAILLVSGRDSLYVTQIPDGYFRLGIQGMVRQNLRTYNRFCLVVDGVRNRPRSNGRRTHTLTLLQPAFFDGHRRHILEHLQEFPTPS